MKLLLVLSFLVFVAGAFADSLDINSDSRNELAVFHAGRLLIASELGATAERRCGGAGDIPVPGNYLNEPAGRVAVWNPSRGLWHVCTDTVTLAVPLGRAGDIPVPADYNGDGLTDYAVFRPLTGEWLVLENSGGLGSGDVQTQVLGNEHAVPVPGDYDGDGEAEIAVFRGDRETGGTLWEIGAGSSPKSRETQAFGLLGDIPVPADFNGDGQVDLAVWRPSDGTWYVQVGESVFNQQFGLVGDIPSPVDFDGDGSADFVVYRPSVGEWFILLNDGAGSSLLKVKVGQIGDRVASSSHASLLDGRAVGDFNGDRLSDLGVVRITEDDKLQFLFLSGTALQHSRGQAVFGDKGDLVAPGDYDGDGITDLAVIKMVDGAVQWKFRLSSEQQGDIREQIVFFGLEGDELLTADFDGDFRADLCVVRNMPDGAKLWIVSNSAGSAMAPIAWGFAADRALNADVDGDGKSDLIAVRELAGQLLWLVRTATGVVLEPKVFGFPTDRPIVGDYNGDGKAEFGVVRDTGGFLLTIIEGAEPFIWGLSDDPVFGGQYSGNRKFSRVAWRVINGQGFFFLHGRGGGNGVIPFGVVDDIPLAPTGITSTGEPEEGGTAGDNSGGDEGSGSGDGGKRLSCASRTNVASQESGFVWKPISESDGKLVVLFGKSRAGEVRRAALVDSRADGDVVLETLRFVGDTNGGRPTFRASKPGKSYPSGVILVRQDTQEQVHCIEVPNPGSRTAT